MLVARAINILTFFSSLAWLSQSSRLARQLGKWVAMLSMQTIKIRDCGINEDNTMDTLAASMTFREEVAKLLISIASMKQTDT